VLFRWLRSRRRRRIAAEPMPPGWDAVLDAIPHVPVLAAGRRGELGAAVRIFVAEKQFFGAPDLEVTDEMRVTVAGLASLMTLGMPDFHFDHVSSIILHRSIIKLPKKVPIGHGAILEDEVEELGDAWLHGPVRLMWPEIVEDLRDPWWGQNLVFHEFAHQLDMMNGDADGVPILPADLKKPWQSVMQREYARLTRQTRRDRQTLLDPYGTTGPQEFFAVASETFFDAPLEMRDEHPELYGLFVRYYRQDPASRMQEK
jgi:Mlc titration factor MtfA (ptsG expression regulator)